MADIMSKKSKKVLPRMCTSESTPPERAHRVQSTRQTALESRVFGVRYRILALPCGGCAADEALGRDLRELYRLMVPEPYCRGHVIFYGPGGHTTP